MFNWFSNILARWRAWRVDKEKKKYILFVDGKPLTKIDSNIPLLVGKMGATNLATDRIRDGNKVRVFEEVDIKIKLS